jgi:hypothetical protein
LRPEQAAAEAARHAAGSESLTELVAEARRKVAEARAARAAAAAAAEQQRKEQLRQRKVEEALRGAVALMEQTAGARGVDAVEEAMRAAAKHVARSEPLTELVAQARVMLEQSRATQAERARAAAAAVEAAERLKMEEELAALTLRMQTRSTEGAADALRMQQMQARLGSCVVPPVAIDAEETLCVVCFDAPKDHIIVPCGHQCVCAACAEQLTKTRTPTCPVCREPIRETMKVFCS